MEREMERRNDKRTALELRPLAITQSVLSRPDGSAKYSFGIHFPLPPRFAGDIDGYDGRQEGRPSWPPWSVRRK